MAEKDLVSNVDAVATIASLNNTTTKNGTSVDLRGYNAAEVVFNYGSLGDGTHTPSIEHSATGSSLWTDAGTDGALKYPAGVTALTAVTASYSVQRAGYVGGKPFLRASDTVSGGSAGCQVGATVLRGHPALGPLA